MSRGLQGQQAWVVQRVTAIYLAAFVILAVGALLAVPADAASWRSLVGHPVSLVLIAFFYVALLWHAWIGIRDVFVDYLHVFWIRLTAYILLLLYLAGCGLWIAKVLITTTLT
jgi:succinate dehydrogenase / fumarate reductase membrane anchor subunit